MPAIFALLFLICVLVVSMLVPVPNAQCNVYNESNDEEVEETMHTTRLNLSKTQLQTYVKKMTEQQPSDNDRLLPGGGKNHALEAMVKCASSLNSEQAVLQQIGDIFS